MVLKMSKMRHKPGFGPMGHICVYDCVYICHLFMVLDMT